MKKITIKLIVFIMSGMAIANASSLSRLPRDVLAHLGSYLTVEDQLVLARTNHEQAYGQSVNARRIYAECIFQDTPVPQEIKSILCRVRNEESQDEISEEIAQYISNKINGGFLYHRKSLPLFLHPYFYQVTSQDLHHILDNNILNQSIPSQALLHMKTHGTYWVHDEETPYIDSFILNYAQLSYISFQNVLQVPADSRIPKYITATGNEVRNYNNTVPLNSFFAFNPDAVLLVDAERSKRLETFNEYSISKVKNIVLIGSHLTHIGDNFLRYTKLASLTLPNTITHIGDSFLKRCYGLTKLDLSSLSNVTSIGERFLDNCGRLTTLDLSSLSNVTTIGDGFLSWCSGLTKLDLSPLSNVTSIGDGFLSNCRGLTTLDLSPLSNVKSIRRFFLSKCISLTTLDLSPLSKVTSIETKFLYDCNSLTTLDLSPLSNVAFIGANFLADCRGLTKLDLSPLSNVILIKPRFLYDCENLQEIFVTKDSCVKRTLRRYPHFRKAMKYKDELDSK